MKNVQSIMFDLKKYRGVIFHDTEGDAKLKKSCLVVWKMTGVWQVFTRAIESLKIGILMGSFNPK